MSVLSSTHHGDKYSGFVNIDRFYSGFININIDVIFDHVHQKSFLGMACWACKQMKSLAYGQISNMIFCVSLIKFASNSASEAFLHVSS